MPKPKPLVGPDLKWSGYHWWAQGELRSRANQHRCAEFEAHDTHRCCCGAEESRHG